MAWLPNNIFSIPIRHDFKQKLLTKVSSVESTKFYSSIALYSMDLKKNRSKRTSNGKKCWNATRAERLGRDVHTCHNASNNVSLIDDR